MTVDASTMVLGIETSCDETAAALVMGGNDVISSVVSHTTSSVSITVMVTWISA